MPCFRPFAPAKSLTCFMSMEMVKKNYAKAPTMEGDMFDSLDLDETEEGIDKSQEEEMTPVTRWLPPEVPMNPKKNYVQVRVTHIDHYGQIVRHYLHSIYMWIKRLRFDPTTFL